MNQSKERIINKYPNRRLYDSVESRYITLTDVRRLVTDRIPFKVIHKKTREDLTASILQQVFADHMAEEKASEQQRADEAALLLEMVRMQSAGSWPIFAALMRTHAALFKKHYRELQALSNKAASLTDADLRAVSERMMQDWRQTPTAPHEGTALPGDQIKAA